MRGKHRLKNISEKCRLGTPKNSTCVQFAGSRMPKQLLIYERAVPVTFKSHGDVSIKSGADYRFASDVNSVPLMASEFDLASTEYAIVFSGDGKDIMPAALLGIRDKENLYIDESGGWKAKYIPAFVRRYPFVFSKQDETTFSLCIDEDFPGVRRDGVGERLFDTKGERTQYLQSVLGFLQAYQVQFEVTRAFCQRLADLNLLESMQAQFRLRSGQQISLGGFMTVSRDRLKALPGDALARLAASGDLDLIYAHLHSQRNFTPTAERLVDVIDTSDGSAAEAEKVAATADG